MQAANPQEALAESPPPAAPGVSPAGAEVVVEHVSKTYDGRIRAVQDVSFELRPGEFAALTGPSGCGKSTMLNLIGSLDRPDSGSIAIEGQPVGQLEDTAAFRRETVGFVFQLHHLLPALTSQANVELPLIASGVRRAERAQRALQLLDQVGLGDRGADLPSELSGGERQRVAVARALANHPRLLLADEPTGALDSATSKRVLDLMLQLQQEYGMTVLMVSYDEAIEERADRIMRMTDGRIVSPGGGGVA